jgi:Ca-activated chloride channel family protein
MRSLSRIAVVALAAATLLPLPAAAQDIIEPPVRCLDCWGPLNEAAQLDGIEADIDVTDGVTVARYEFSLSNPIRPEQPQAGVGAEGRIVFPVPPGSSVTDLVLSGGPEALEGKLLDADDATRIYEDIVRRLIDPALLRSLDGDLYEVRAFPVPPGEERQVSFTVTTPLLAEGEQALVEVPWSRMSPRPTAGQVNVDVDVPWEVRSAVAPGFDVDRDRRGAGELGVDWESPTEWAPDTNFRLYLSGGEGLVDTRLLPFRERDEDGYFSLLFSPVIEIDEQVARDVVVVLDRSGSMEGDKMAQAIDAAAYVLDNLGADDRFGIVDFSRYVRTFDVELRPASDASAGIDYVRELAAGGNTNISGALERGLEFLDGSRPGTVIFVTDGLPTVGIERTDGILEIAEGAAPERTQVFAFGVGYDVDTLLLDTLADAFTGTSHYVTPEEQIDIEVARLYERVSAPVLSEVHISIDGVDTWDLAPAELHGIFAGNQAMLTGRYDQAGAATVTVTGNSAGGPETFTYDVTFPERDEADPTIAQLWGQRRVAHLLTELRIEGVRESLVEELVEVANQFGIVTPYTAYLAEEPEMALQRPRPLPGGPVGGHGGAFEMAMDEAEALASSPTSGQEAVRAASAVEELRDADGAVRWDSQKRERLQVVGAHTYVELDGTWTRRDYDPEIDAPEVEVGSAEFLALLREDPSLAEAAALGESVITLGPDGWITIVWPDVDG